MSNPYEDEARWIGVPLIPPLAPELPPIPKTDGTTAICGECGLHLQRSMSYMCPNPRCPCGLGKNTDYWRIIE